ncbi:MAG: MerR family transcriptional regulator [Flavobacteriales bacterium]|nr:MerR family transcriptional regulator [Flavobacteriales bacterium]
MNKIQNFFTINDLENLSGVKAHTIRIWEKRYNLLSPSRTEGNIRTYDIEALQKLLNVAALNEIGYKISRISELKANELGSKVISETSNSSGIEHYINKFKMAMVTFNQSIFEQTYSQLLAGFSFRQIFLDILIPFLHRVGLEWQSQNITPAHEHFISNLVKQKLHINIERVQFLQPQNGVDNVYVNFLPDGEMHELALLYIHYEASVKGYRSIFLGQSVPMQDIVHISKLFNKITFVSHFTVEPVELNSYLTEFDKEVLVNSNHSLWVSGRKVKTFETSISPKIILFNEILEIINKI